MSFQRPRNWIEATLDEVVEICDNLREPVNAKERAGRHGPYPYYGATGQVGWIDGFRQDGEYVLLGEDGAPFLDPVKAKAYLVSGKCWVNNHAHVIRGRDGICQNRYLMHALNITDYRDFANGTTRLKLTQDAMRRLPIRIAPPNEQTRIVAKVEELLSDLDAGVVALERARANLKRYRAAALKAAVEGRLTAEWRKTHPDAEPAGKLLERILAERRRKWEEAQLAKFAAAGKSPPKTWKDKYPEPAKPNTINFPELPGGWCWVTVEQCSGFADNAITDGPFGSNLKTEHYTASGPRVIRLQNIGDGGFIEQDAHISEKHFERLSKHQVSIGDVIVAMLGESLPRACLIPGHIPPAIVKADCAKISAHRELCSNVYLALALNSQLVRENAQKNIKGVGRPRLNLSHIRELHVPLPPRDEQEAIVSIVEQNFSMSEQASKQITADVERSSRLRQAILKRAFEGKLVPQDPSDEPASVLLEHIRDARAAEASAPRVSRRANSSKRRAQ